jgi:hypothetical protein
MQKGRGRRFNGRVPVYGFFGTCARVNPRRVSGTLHGAVFVRFFLYELAATRLNG